MLLKSTDRGTTSNHHTQPTPNPWVYHLPPEEYNRFINNPCRDPNHKFGDAVHLNHGGIRWLFKTGLAPAQVGNVGHWCINEVVKEGATLKRVCWGVHRENLAGGLERSAERLIPKHYPEDYRLYIKDILQAWFDFKKDNQIPESSSSSSSSGTTRSIPPQSSVRPSLDWLSLRSIDEVLAGSVEVGWEDESDCASTGGSST